MISKVVAQVPDTSYVIPKGEYLFPIKPGTPALLAGTMGELRATHFHTGIDIRTNNEIGWPVLAAQDGYIARAGASGTGFGNVLYINHPDGNTTLYGHLDRFKGAVGNYILEERYRRKTSDIELFFRENQFKVKKGDTIGYAGNTGSSGGPHLHFDIRRGNLALDPLKFGFAEVKDVLPPIIQKIALKTLDINSRINDQFGRFEFYAVRSGTNYILPAPILAYGKIGIELLGYDRVDYGRFKCGINYIEVVADSKKIFHQTIEHLNLNDSRGIYGMVDYKAARNQGNRFYKLYIDDSNRAPHYYSSPDNGVITINPDNNTAVTIIASDLSGNKTTVALTLKPSAPAQTVALLTPLKTPVAYEVMENTLSVNAMACAETSASVFSRGLANSIAPAYANTHKLVYTIDLRKTIPDSLQVCSQTIKPNIRQAIPSGIEYKYYSDEADITFPQGALFDTTYLSLNHLMEDGLEYFSVGNPLVPLGRSVHVTLKPKRNYQVNKNLGVYRVAGKGFAYEGGRWSNGMVTISLREFGTFTIMADTIAPTVTVIYANSQAARFRIRDNLSGIASFEATINGQWLLMNYDAKTNIIMSEKLNKKQPLKGNLELTVTDNAGNRKLINIKIP